MKKTIDELRAERDKLEEQYKESQSPWLAKKLWSANKVLDRACIAQMRTFNTPAGIPQPKQLNLL